MSDIPSDISSDISSHASDAPSDPAPQRPRLSLLSFGFVLCGMATVLPGPLLPMLAARWHLADVQSGAFFTAVFGASSVGAILSPRRIRVTLPAGYSLITAGLLLLLASGEVTGAPGHGLALAGFTVIGLGIGLSVTATNLTVAAMTNGRTAGERARGLSLVNLWWGIGAVACPWLIAVAERHGELQWLLAAMALCAGGTFAALWPMLLRRGRSGGASAGVLRSNLPVLAFFAVFLFLYVGVETVVGGWITTYAHRFEALTVARASLLVSVYWLAMLGGRGLGSLLLRSVPERAILLPGLGIGLAAVSFLVEPHSTATVLAAVIATGVGFGPVFPIGVSRMLSRIRDHRNTGIVFALCASGGAVLPWLTGLVSTGTGSLRVGLAVPVAALVALLGLALGENALLRRSGERQQ